MSFEDITVKTKIARRCSSEVCQFMNALTLKVNKKNQKGTSEEFWNQLITNYWSLLKNDDLTGYLTFSFY